MNRRALTSELPAIAQIDDVLAGHAEHSGGLSRGDQSWRPLHDGKPTTKRNKHNATSLGCEQSFH